jgi:hypothetical protein
VPAAFGLARPIDVTRAIEADRIAVARVRDLARPSSWRPAPAATPVARSIVWTARPTSSWPWARPILRRLGMTRRDPDVILAGGVFAAPDESFETRIRKGLQAVAPRAEGPPVARAAGARGGAAGPRSNDAGVGPAGTPKRTPGSAQRWRPGARRRRAGYGAGGPAIWK